MNLMQIMFLTFAVLFLIAIFYFFIEDYVKSSKYKIFRCGTIKKLDRNNFVYEVESEGVSFVRSKLFLKRAKGNVGDKILFCCSTDNKFIISRRLTDIRYYFIFMIIASVDFALAFLQ